MANLEFSKCFRGVHLLYILQYDSRGVGRDVLDMVNVNKFTQKAAESRKVQRPRQLISKMCSALSRCVNYILFQIGLFSAFLS